MTKAEIKETIQFVVDKGGIDAAQAKARAIQLAIDSLNILRIRQRRPLLINFAEFVVSRNK